jgi:SUMO ligase MMS21 Smc5/6 complex component
MRNLILKNFQCKKAAEKIAAMERKLSNFSLDLKVLKSSILSYEFNHKKDKDEALELVQNIRTRKLKALAELKQITGRTTKSGSRLKI